MRMRAIVIQQPWASLIASGKKTLEVRSWRTNHRGPLLIVAGRKIDETLRALPHGDASSLPRGVALCIVNLSIIRPGNESDTEFTGGVDPTGFLVWHLDDVQPIEPFPVRGQQMLFDVDL